MSGKSWSKEVILEHPILWSESPSSLLLHGLGQGWLPPYYKPSIPASVICSAACLYPISLSIKHPLNKEVTLCHHLWGLKPQIPNLRKTSVLGKPRQFVTWAPPKWLRLYSDFIHYCRSTTAMIFIPVPILYEQTYTDLNFEHIHTHAQAHTPLLKILQWLPLPLDFQMGLQSPPFCMHLRPTSSDRFWSFILFTVLNTIIWKVWWLGFGFFFFNYGKFQTYRKVEK